MAIDSVWIEGPYFLQAFSLETSLREKGTCFHCLFNVYRKVKIIGLSYISWREEKDSFPLGKQMEFEVYNHGTLELERS